MSFFNSRYPLGLPKGSVRAALVISLTVAVVAPILKLSTFHEDIPPGVEKLLDMALGGLIATINQYLNRRDDEGPSNNNGASVPAAPPAS